MRFKLISMIFLAFTTIPVDNSQFINHTQKQETVTMERNDVEVVQNGEVTYNTIVFTDVNETVFAATSVNIRECPDADSNRVGGLARGESVQRIGVGENGWSKIIYKDMECYINSKYISTTEPIKEPVQETVVEPVNEPAPVASFIQREGNVSNSVVNAVEKYYNMIPANVRTFLQNNGMTIYVTDMDLANRFYAGQYSSVLGVTVYGTKTIYLEDRKKASNMATIHECGHMLDSFLGYKSQSQEFYDLYMAEKGTFVEVGAADANSYSSTTEYFAEVFQQAIIYPDSCRNSAPNSYNYIMNIINGM